ncbi:hypothetical protein KIH27_14975 [Mycobacterium sp. M1]|uniref:Uncharacterized protein n=1 Tax=Mycolicibacter acidiphilus TaxID=2835306 RepID=A0ABS5RMV3_9MYCO|nr:hypothetical protein [Mycolicibacter acidiphilus]MBS9534894.1 hypothetical protein [Mycolicibacter acidiphilus]
MNATDWATELLRSHSVALTAVQMDDTRALIADGDGWLAAYDLFRDGIDDGWLDDADLTVALELARAGAFSKFSADVERTSAALLSRKTESPSR